MRTADLICLLFHIWKVCSLHSRLVLCNVLFHHCFYEAAQRGILQSVVGACPHACFYLWFSKKQGGSRGTALPYLSISRFLRRVTVTSSACVLIFNTHSFRFLHYFESHCRYFESTLRYALLTCSWFLFPWILSWIPTVSPVYGWSFIFLPSSFQISRACISFFSKTNRACVDGKTQRKDRSPIKAPPGSGGRVCAAWKLCTLCFQHPPRFLFYFASSREIYQPPFTCLLSIRASQFHMGRLTHHHKLY